MSAIFVDFEWAAKAKFNLLDIKSMLLLEIWISITMVSSVNVSGLFQKSKMNLFD